MRKAGRVKSNCAQIIPVDCDTQLKLAFDGSLISQRSPSWRSLPYTGQTNADPENLLNHGVVEELIGSQETKLFGTCQHSIGTASHMSFRRQRWQFCSSRTGSNLVLPHCARFRPFGLTLITTRANHLNWQISGDFRIAQSSTPLVSVLKPAGVAWCSPAARSSLAMPQCESSGGKARKFQ